MQERKFARRFAGILRHRKAGFSSNAMAVWIVPPERLNEVGPMLAGYRAVTHCYKRPTFPSWPYNLFTMIHAGSQKECEDVVESMTRESGLEEVLLLYSTREYKKTRVKYFLEDQAGAAA